MVQGIQKILDEGFREFQKSYRGIQCARRFHEDVRGMSGIFMRFSENMTSVLEMSKDLFRHHGGFKGVSDESQVIS